MSSIVKIPINVYRFRNKWIPQLTNDHEEIADITLEINISKKHEIRYIFVNAKDMGKLSKNNIHMEKFSLDHMDDIGMFIGRETPDIMFKNYIRQPLIFVMYINDNVVKFYSIDNFR